MLIRDIRTNQQLSNAKKLQAEYLQLMIDNEKLLEERVNNYKNPNKPPPVPPQYKSASEIQLDSMKQERDAIDNLLSLGLDYPTASTIAQSLQQRQDGVANLLKLNKNFPFIKKDITERFNPKLLDSRVLLTYLDEVFRELDETMGLKTTSQTSTNFFQRDATGVKGVLPTGEMIDRLSNIVFRYLAGVDINEEDDNQLRRIIQLLSENLPTELELIQIDSFPPLERNRIFKDAERLIKTYHIPTTSFINERIEKLNKFINERHNEIEEDIYELNQGIPGGGGGGGAGGAEIPPPPPPGRPPISERVVIELSILLNNLGLIDNRGIEKLKEFKNILKKNEDKIDIKSKKIYGEERVLEEEPNLSLQQHTGEVVEEKRQKEEEEKIMKEMEVDRTKEEQYLIQKINNLSSRDALIRLSKYSKFYPGTALANYKLEAPIYEDKNGEKYPIIEWTSDGGTMTRVDRPFYFNNSSEMRIVGSSGLKRAVNQPDDYEDYLLVNIANNLRGNKRYEANKDPSKIRYTFTLTQGSINNPRTYRYDEEEMKEIIENVEVPLLLEQKGYDPGNRRNVSQRKIPTQGFGLTNKIIKHFKEDNRDLEDLNKSFKKHMQVEKKVDDSESDSDSEKKKGKGVLKKFTHTRIKIGKGIEVEEEPKFKTFGKYIIHMRHLADNNVLNVKFPSGGTIPSIKPVQIDDNFKDFIYDVLNSGKMNERHFNNLTKSEQNHFVKIAKGAKLINKLGIKTNDDLTSEAEVNRFELLKGEYDAGNNNGNLVKELRGLVIKFMKGGRINKKQGMDFLLELSIV